MKVTVDAYTGKVDLYVSDPDDSIIKVYRAIFPELLKPITQMPADLKRHIRYPRGFFAIQTSLYATYHMDDPKVFYNKEDLWEVPSHGEKSMEPYYLIMKLPEEKKEEYALLIPYTPAKRDNLAAWFAARCDEPNYGKLVVYTFPRDRLVFGPRQVDARIDQDSYISQQLTLWGQRGSQVIRGSLLIIPVETSLIYIQPLYLAAEDKGGLPELTTRDRRLRRTTWLWRKTWNLSATAFWGQSGPRRLPRQPRPRFKGRPLPTSSQRRP